VPGPALATRSDGRREPSALHAIQALRAAHGQAHRSMSPTASRILELQRTAGNRAVAGAIAQVQREDKDDDAGKPDVISGADKAAPRRTTGFMGLNPGANKEAAKLKKSTREQVLESYNDPVAEAKFQSDPEIMNFVFDELGIPVVELPRWDKASEVLKQANPHLREQLADLMRWFNKAEKGEITLDRLVLSGHSNGVELWGESEVGQQSQPGTMLIDRDLHGIADVFPKAAAQVEDIMFSACFSINAVLLVIKVFPNLKTAWSYSNFSPNVEQGSPEHVGEFAKATEGAGTLTKANRRGSSALWTREKGFVVGDPSLAAAGPLYTEALRKFREIAEPMLDGSGPDLTSPQLMPVYLAIQQMMAHPGTPADRKERAEHVMQIVLRLRFWPVIRERFGAEYHDKLQPAYDALGMTQPEWKGLTRKALREHVEGVMKALESKPDATSFKPLLEQYLVKGILGLDDKTVIKPDWI
jgi:hypothetical protein